MRYEPSEIPVGVEAASRHFAAACLRDGWTGCVTLTCSAGQVDYLSATVGKDHHTHTLVEDDWFEVLSDGA